MTNQWERRLVQEKRTQERKFWRASEILSLFNIYLFISSIYLFSQARSYFRYTGSLILVVLCEI